MIPEAEIRSVAVQNNSRGQPNRGSTGETCDADGTRAVAVRRHRPGIEPRSAADDNNSTSTRQLRRAKPSRAGSSRHCDSSGTSRTGGCSKTP